MAVLTMQARRVGGSRGSNEPPKIFEVGILGGIEKIKKFTKKQKQKK